MEVNEAGKNFEAEGKRIKEDGLYLGDGTTGNVYVGF
jgi:hypothetical protein